MNEKRLHRACFTGHRPGKLMTLTEYQIKERTRAIVKNAISQGKTTFISGMAQGFDLIAAEAVLLERAGNDMVKLIAASPFNGVEAAWSDEWKTRYRNVLEQADLIRYICEGYSRNCYQIRNEWMVDRSSLVIALYNGTSGGTRNTIRYAEEHGVPVTYVPTTK